MVKIKLKAEHNDGFYNVVIIDIFHKYWLDKSDLLELKDQIDEITGE